LWFAEGIPGFERERRLVPIEIPAQRPLVYLQSAENPDVCFLSLPAAAVTSRFQLELGPDDYPALGLDPGADPIPGQDVLCLALLGPAAGAEIQTNLAAPVVISLACQRGHQLTPAGEPEIWRLGPGGVWEAMCS
jgi:flagellar assembly factor FliW